MHSSAVVTELLLDWTGATSRLATRSCRSSTTSCDGWRARFSAASARDHTLQATALVHEAYLRLIDQRQVDWTNRAQFVGVAAVMMRRILVNHARGRAADKRGGEAERVSLSLAHIGEAPSVDLIALHEALDALAAIDARKSRIVELKFFGGLTTAEMAEVMELSPATIEREWSFSRAWLYDALAGGAA